MTIKEIAKLAGVSPAAVSRYFNGGSLGEEKQKRIRQVIEETGYLPNTAAQTMRTGKSGQIGVIVPTVHSDSLSCMMAGIAERLDEKKYIMILGCTEDSMDNTLRYMDVMQRNQVEGMILMAAEVPQVLKDKILESHIPVVVTGQNIPDIACIYHDDENALRDLTARVLAKGRYKLAYLGVAETDEAVGVIRKQSVLKAWVAAGHPAEKLIFKQVDYSMESGREAMEELLREHPEVDSVICATDTIALGAYQAIRKAGKHIPEEIALAGVGDSAAGMVMQPELTTVHFYYQECGYAAVDLLFQLMEEGEESACQVMLDYHILE